MKKEYGKDYFTLVQDDERLVDKPLKTKQLSYFQDALLRFTKNKYNLVATIILFIIILLSIFVPMATPSRFYSQSNPDLKVLPPRVPLLEKLGIFDGTKGYSGQFIDYSTVDSETGLGYPTVGFDPKYIDMSTLENQVIYGSLKDPSYLGGTSDLYIDARKESVAVISNESRSFYGTTFTVDIESLNGNGTFELYISDKNKIAASSWAEMALLGSIISSGVHSVVIPSTVTPAQAVGYLVLRYSIIGQSDGSSDYVSINSVVTKNSGGQVIVNLEGYELSQLDILPINPSSEGGRYVRNNAHAVTASFKYDVYGAIFSPKEKILSEEEYLRIVGDNPDMEASKVVDPLNSKKWSFGEGYPLISVTEIVISLPGISQTYSNFRVIMDGKYALGFDDVPYFYFGTDPYGKDMFSLVWLGLRTSLLLGVFAAAINIVIGIIWGAISGYYGGKVDLLMERFTDIWGSFPQIAMIGIIRAFFGSGFWPLLLFLVYDGWIGAASVTRMQFYRYKGKEYVLAARTLGASDGRIIFRHIFPNTLGTIVTRVVLSIPGVIFVETNLSYLNLGLGGGPIKFGPISLPGYSLGIILSEGQDQFFSGNWWLVAVPAIIVAILMITFNMFGNALRDALNPQLRGNEK